MTEDRKTCLITGANSGIGKQAAIQIAQAGLRVVLACRNRARGEAAVVDVRQASNSESVELLPVDMSLQASVREAAATFLETHEHLDVLIHNAAFFDLTQKQRTVTQEGVETTWACNHLGPVLMTDLLRPALERADQGRVVLISSKGLVLFPNLAVDLEDPEFERRRFTVQKAYYQSKLAQVAWLLHLAEDLEDTDITVHGVRVTNVKIDTTRYPGLSKLMRWAYSLKSMFSITPGQMAETYTWLATHDSGRTTTGGYWDAIDKPAKPSRYAADPEHRAAIVALTRSYVPAP